MAIYPLNTVQKHGTQKNQACLDSGDSHAMPVRVVEHLQMVGYIKDITIGQNYGGFVLGLPGLQACVMSCLFVCTEVYQLGSTQQTHLKNATLWQMTAKPISLLWKTRDS